ncbi:alpha/beta fold hydrolase [Pseudonocardia sp. KRD291]|uniref:alpha/beta fold hydrolase n=1 Tax=Pseudonocardia sp. KRD291 TaxID=2792007 RepID=UPI001C4A06B0|nr:alpha/beta fold hydrolase [Pseudonocardia sp. KRD291]MBW0104412.1 alpha/beta fold hydrolase [Pseudonocardia sp. KRD291]
MSEPLVLLPGMNCSSRLWDGLPTLRRWALHPRLGRPDIDGCVDALLDALPPRFALAGLSLGGIVAMALVRRAPERVTRLCLIATNARPPTTAQREAWAAQRAALDAGRSAREVQRDLLDVLVHHRTPGCDETVLALADGVGESDLMAQLLAQDTRVDERPALARVAVPTLVLAAARDRICPVDRHEEMHALIPGSRLTVLDGIGHLIPVEAPAAAAEALEDWLGWPVPA